MQSRAQARSRSEAALNALAVGAQRRDLDGAENGSILACVMASTAPVYERC